MLSIDFAMTRPGDSLGSGEGWRVRALAELPPLLRQRLVELGMGEAGSVVDAEVAAAMNHAVE